MTQIFLTNPSASMPLQVAGCRIRVAGLLATSALVAAWSAPALADGPIEVPLDVMFDLGALEDGEDSYSYATDVSADGNVVVGGSRVNISENNWEYHAFIWTPQDGMVDLGTLGGEWSYGEDVSADGSVIVGHSQLGGEDGNYDAFRWT